MKFPEDFDGQRDLLLMAQELMLKASRYCAREAVSQDDDGFPDRAKEYREYSRRNAHAADALYAVAMTYDLPLWDVDD